MMKTTVTMIFVLALYFMPFQSAQEQQGDTKLKPGTLTFPSKEMLGESFFPQPLPKGFEKTPDGKGLLFKTTKVPTDQSDWEGLPGYAAIESRQIKSIRVFGFEKINSWKLIDTVIDDDDILEMFTEGMHPDNIFRPCQSDLGWSASSTSGGDYLGVLRIDYGDEIKPIIVGVGSAGFYLGVYHGTRRQSFYAPRLANALKITFDKKLGVEIDDKIHNTMSGKFYFDEPASDD